MPSLLEALRRAEGDCSGCRFLGGWRFKLQRVFNILTCSLAKASEAFHMDCPRIAGGFEGALFLAVHEFCRIPAISCANGDMLLFYLLVLNLGRE